MLLSKHLFQLLLPCAVRRAGCRARCFQFRGTFLEQSL
jgi:hypothetical protein